EKVTWEGKLRPSIPGLGVYPRPIQESIPVWLGVGGTPNSAVRAGTMGLPMALAILGGHPARFQPFVQLFRESARQAGHDADNLPLAINTHFYTADTSQQAAADLYPSYIAMMNRIGRERGWAPMGREYY